jgi:medium-chain acyl-[acyl-carrier-protein] hydrolase
VKSKYGDNPWLIYGEPNSKIRLRLFCFPYCGSGASIFRQWPENMPESIGICPVQFPGRENRIDEPLFTVMPRLIDVMAANLDSCFDIPFALFGHSMGGVVAFELARYLSHAQGIDPVHLFVSASRPPHIREPRPVHQLPKQEFINVMRNSGGIPKAVLQNNEFMELIEPILRADFTLIETLPGSDREPLAIPITAFGGTEDTYVTAAMVDAWRKYTSSTFSIKMLPGNHFFLNSARSTLLQSITQILLPYLNEVD